MRRKMIGSVVSRRMGLGMMRGRPAGVVKRGEFVVRRWWWREKRVGLGEGPMENVMGSPALALGFVSGDGEEKGMRMAEAYFGYFVYGKVGPMARGSDGMVGVVSDIQYDIA
tara:strand:+ start:4466 stop:4801 length:336 start_codon:yes stop_codon:yes gene_type:complete